MLTKHETFLTFNNCSHGLLPMNEYFESILKSSFYFTLKFFYISKLYYSSSTLPGSEMYIYSSHVFDSTMILRSDAANKRKSFKEMLSQQLTARSLLLMLIGFEWNYELYLLRLTADDVFNTPPILCWNSCRWWASHRPWQPRPRPGAPSPRTPSYHCRPPPRRPSKMLTDELHAS